MAVGPAFSIVLLRVVKQFNWLQKVPGNPSAFFWWVTISLQSLPGLLVSQTLMHLLKPPYNSPPSGEKAMLVAAVISSAASYALYVHLRPPSAASHMCMGWACMKVASVKAECGIVADFKLLSATVSR